MSRVTDCAFNDHTLPDWTRPEPLPQDIIGVCDCGLVRYVLDGDTWVPYAIYAANSDPTRMAVAPI